MGGKGRSSKSHGRVGGVAVTIKGGLCPGGNYPYMCVGCVAGGLGALPLIRHC